VTTTRWTWRSAGARALGGVLAAMMLLVPSGMAVAAEDPVPVPWPAVDKPDTGGTAADPAPAAWPAVSKPETGGNGTDPAPQQWPAPQPG
jgi:hypothetical protein